MVVSYDLAIANAAILKSEGDNPEYDRALVEFILILFCLCPSDFSKVERDIEERKSYHV